MGIPSWARVGAKVVCIRDRRYSVGNMSVPDQPVRKGEILTIREVIGQLDEWPEDSFWLGFVERHPKILCGGSRFRPLHTLETDIYEHFADLLHVPNQVDA